jgi:hypothetical protein
MRFFIVSTACALLMVSTQTFASVECPKPTQQLATDVSVKIRSEVGQLPASTKPEFDASAETITRDLFTKYQNSDTVALAHSTISIFCQVLITSSLTDAQKFDQLYRLEDWITRISGHSVPMNPATGTDCSTASQDVLRPIKAVFNAWAHLDIGEYITQWGPGSIQRSHYYARQKPDIVNQRRSDFAKYASVAVLGTDPKILFVDGAKARVSNIYSMRFVRRDGRVVNETEVGESYILECSAADNRWVIRENNDYIFRPIGR